MNFQNGNFNSNNKLTYFLEETNPKDNYPSIKFNQYKKGINENTNNNYYSQNNNYVSNLFNKLNKSKSSRTPILTSNTTFDYKKDLKKIGIIYDSSDSENNSFNNINTDFNEKTLQYNNNLIKNNINDNIYDNNNIYNNYSLMSNQIYNNNSNLQNSKNDFIKKGNGTKALSNYLSDLTKNKMKKMELAKRSTYLNPFGNNISYLNIHNYIRENYAPNKDNMSFHSKFPLDELKINKSKNINVNQDNNVFLNQNKNLKKINNNFLNDPLNDKENIEMKLNKNKLQKESENEDGEFEEFESYEEDNIKNKNDNNNFYTFNNNNLSNIENPNLKMNFSNDNISNILDENFVKFLKEENEKLKNLNNTYKQLIDSLFYFINELSHKFSYYQELFDISYYINHVDDLSKTLIGLEYCILSQSNPKNGQNFEEFKKSINSNFYKQFKLPLPLKTIHEISFQIPEILDNKTENNIINTFNNSNIKNSKIDTSNHSSIIKEKRSKSQSKNNSNIFLNKKDHDCIACNLGNSISKKGYSTMAHSPYNTSNSLHNCKNESNKNLTKQIPKSLSQKYSTKKLKKLK